MLPTDNFPNNMKLADIMPIFLKKDPLQKENYIRLSVLSAISNIFGKLMQKQILGYVENLLSPYLNGYRKNFKVQQALLALMKNWKKVSDNKGFGGATLMDWMDLSKVFATIKYNLLIAMLGTYGSAVTVSSSFTVT